jgi:enamine deaminase RidA (YjgF/YER057c/UK114 family)
LTGCAAGGTVWPAAKALGGVVQVNVLLRDVWNIPVMEQVFRRRFKGQYPARKTLSTDFAHVGGPGGLEVQIDGIAYRGSSQS